MNNTSQFQSETSNHSPECDNSDKLIRKNLVKDITIDIVNSKMSNGGRVPHGEFNKYLERVNDICPTITRSMINKAVRLHWTSVMYIDECDIVSNEDNDMDDNFSRNRGGRPVGTTIVFKHEFELRRVKVQNNISVKYVFGKRSLPYGKRLPRGRLNEIIESVTSKYGLDSSDVCPITIRQRATRSDDAIVNRMHDGHISPMAKVEDKLVGLIIQMARIRHLLTPSSSLKLANDFISGTQTEKDVIDFKNKYCFNESDDGKILLGRGYFKGFKKRNAYRIVSKRGQ